MIKIAPLKTETSVMTPIQTIDDALPFAGKVVAYVSDSGYFGKEGHAFTFDPSLRFGYVKQNSTQFPVCKNGKVNLDANPFLGRGFHSCSIAKGGGIPFKLWKGKWPFFGPSAFIRVCYRCL